MGKKADPNGRFAPPQPSRLSGSGGATTRPEDDEPNTRKVRSQLSSSWAHMLTGKPSADLLRLPHPLAALPTRLRAAQDLLRPRGGTPTRLAVDLVRAAALPPSHPAHRARLTPAAVHQRRRPCQGQRLERGADGPVPGAAEEGRGGEVQVFAAGGRAGEVGGVSGQGAGECLALFGGTGWRTRLMDGVNRLTAGLGAGHRRHRGPRPADQHVSPTQWSTTRLLPFEPKTFPSRTIAADSSRLPVRAPQLPILRLPPRGPSGRARHAPVQPPHEQDRARRARHLAQKVRSLFPLPLFR